MPLRIAPLRTGTGALVFAPLLFTAAETAPPTIQLNGLAVITLPVGATWVDPGATAFDASGIPLAVTPSGSVNTAQANSYTIGYTSAQDSAGRTAYISRTVIVYAASTSFADARDTMRVVRPNSVVYLHDNATIPMTSPKDPNSRIFKGFELLGFADGEIIIAHSVLINGQAVAPGGTVAGLTFHGTQTNSINKIKVEISGGTIGATYRLTLRYSTQYTASDDRSLEFEVREL